MSGDKKKIRQILIRLAIIRTGMISEQEVKLVFVLKWHNRFGLSRGSNAYGDELHTRCVE
jgi:hypothetical protein